MIKYNYKKTCVKFIYIIVYYQQNLFNFKYVFPKFKVYFREIILVLVVELKFNSIPLSFAILQGTGA